MDNQKSSKFISFNCKSVTRSADYIRILCKQADIIALQETWLFPHNISFLGNIDESFGYTGKSAIDTSVGIFRGRPYGGVALLWRKSVFSSVSVIECNSVRLAAIKVTTCDRAFIVFSIYMPVDSGENLVEFTDCLSEMSAIIESTEVASVFMLGDFNAHPKELFGQELLSFCRDQQWTCVDIERLDTAFTFISDAHGCTRWLDHCLVTEAAMQSVVDVKVHYDSNWSDHLPLEINCNLGILSNRLAFKKTICNKVLWGERTIKQIEKYHSLCHDKLRDLHFPNELHSCCDNMCNNPDHKLILDSMYENVVDIMSKAAVDSYEGALVSKKKRHVVGWNKHVQDAHKKARLCFQLWLLHGRPSRGLIYNNMAESRRVFKSKLKWCQNNANQIQADILATHQGNKNFRAFWRHTSKLNPKPCTPLSVGGTNDPFEIANKFVGNFRVQPSTSQPPASLRALMPNSRVATNPPVRFTAKEVTSVIRNMTRGKSPGYDGISIEHLKHAGVHLPRVLSMLLTFCLRHSYLPKQCMKTVVVPIVKNKTGDLSDISNYRPISLATTIAKVLDGLLDQHLCQHIDLHDTQFGFRAGLSTEAAIMCLKQTVRYYTDRKTPVYACFLDLSKAFDLVSYELLWNKLRSETALPEEVINIFDYWHSHQVNVVRWSNVFSEEYRLKCGVRQGGLTSPRLFNFYINKLLGDLSNTKIGCSIDDTMINNISYADDMVLLSPSICGVRKMLQMCEEYAGTHGLKYNAKKSELLVFQPREHKVKIIPPVWLYGIPLKRVSQFKYLGHWVSEDLKDDADIERERRALAVRGNMLARRFAYCTKEVKVTLFKAYCQSFYTCSLWVSGTQAALSVLRIQYNNVFRMLLGLPRFCSASGMFAEARTDGFHAIMRKRAASLLHRVRTSTNSILKVLANKHDCPIMRHWMSLHVSL